MSNNTRIVVDDITQGDLENIEFELEKEAVDKDNKKHYVNNKELYEEFVKYHKRKMELKEKHNAAVLEEFGFDHMEDIQGQDKHTVIEFNRAIKQFTPPPLTDKIGKAILDISYRRCYSPRFVNYAPNWKEEMISDAIETGVRYAHNFNPEKSNNPFAYLTRLVTNAIFQRLKKEHTQQYIKMKLFDDSHGFAGDVDKNNVNEDELETINETNDMYRDRLHYIDQFETIKGIDKEKRKQKAQGHNNGDEDENLLNMDD